MNLFDVLQNSVEKGKIDCNDIIKFISKDKKWIKGFKNKD